MDLSKQYAVIHFEESNRVEVIPTKWMSSENECVYPPYNSTSRTLHAIQNSIAPEENWVSYRIKILYTTDSYITAMSKLSLAEDSDSLLTEYNSKGRPVRRKRKSAKMVSSDSSLDTDSDLHTIQQRQASNSTDTPIAVASTSLCISTIAKRTSNKSSTASCVSHKSSKATTDSCKSTSGSATFVSASKEFQTIIEALAALQTDMDAIKKTLEKNHHTVMNLMSEKQKTYQFAMDTPLPIQQLEQLEQLEIELCNKEKCAGFRKELVHLGGNDVRECISRMFLLIFSRDFLDCFNYSGKQSHVSVSAKKAFKDTKLKVVFSDAIRDIGVSTSLKETEDCIMKFLRSNSDLLAARKRREKKEE